jgi:hypothetical protein
MKVFILCFFLFWVSIGNTQEYYKSFHFTADDGLPTNTIYSITEGQNGTIILGTDNGLTFFNGNVFKTLNVKEGLINPNIVAVKNDIDGTIWFINYGGRLQKLEHNKIINTNVFCGYFNQIINTKKNLFLYTKQAIYKNNKYPFIQFEKQKKTLVNSDELLKRELVAPPILEQNNIEIQLKNNELCYKNNKVPLPKEVKLIHKVIFRKDNVCILDELNLFIVNFKGEILYTIPLPQPLSEKSFNKFDFIIDQQGKCWLNIQGKGLFVIKNNQWVSVQNSLGLNTDENINFLFSDSRGILWIATNHSGLFCIPSSFVETIRFENRENKFMGFATTIDKQGLYAATNFSLYLYKNQKINLLEKSSLPFWIEDINDKPIYYLPYFQKNSSDKELKSLYKMSGRQFIRNVGESYFSSYGLSGIVLHEKTNTAFKEHFLVMKNPTKEKITKIVYYNKEYYFNNREKIDVRILKEGFIYPKRELKLKNIGFIQDFIFINDTMWIAANDAVYKVFNEKIVDSITHVNEAKLKNVQKIKNIRDDKYLCTGNGLFIIGKKGNRVLNKFNCLPSNEVNNVILFQNKLFVATTDGLAIIDQKNIDNKTIRPILNVFFNKQKTRRIYVASEVETIDLKIDIQNFNSTKNQIVQYKIENSPWSNTSGEDLIIPIQSYGKHTVIIRVKDINSDWTVKTIVIDRALPFYYEWWFIALVIVLFLLLVFGIYRFQITKIKKRKQQEIAINNKIVELRQNALAALMNPHFIFNSLSSIQYFINSNQTQKSSDYLGKLSRLARLFLIHASSPTISLEEEINRLNLYIELEQVRFNYFKYNLIIDRKIELSTTIIPNMIVQPFIENAILHGISHLANQDGEITLNIMLEKQLLTIEVIDNGFGIDGKENKGEGHVSKGIKIIQERIDILQQSYPDKEFSITQESLFPEQLRKGHKVRIKVTIIS